jgi:hypothetical protein
MATSLCPETRQELLGESGIRDRIEINLDGCMASINPASGMPIADLTIAHKRVEALCQSIGAKHSVLDWKHHGAFRGRGHGEIPFGTVPR